MKKVILILAGVVGLTTMQSCRRDIEKSGATSASIEITAGVSGVVSKASKVDFAVDDMLGMWVVPNVKLGVPGNLYPIDNYKDNVLYKNDGTSFKSAEQVLYPSPDAFVDLYAVYPYQAGMSAQVGNTMTNPSAFAWAVKRLQTAKDSVVLSDIMTSFYKNAKQGTTPALAFKHRLSQVLIKFAVPAQYNKKSVTAVKKVELVGLRLKSTVNIVDTAAVPVVATDNATNAKVDIEAYGDVKPASTVDGNYVYEAIVVPQSVSVGDYIVRLTLAVDGMGDVVFNCKTGKSYSYDAKHSTIINVNIEGQTEILLGASDVTISGWRKASDVVGNTLKMNKIIFDVLNVGGANTNVDKVKVAKMKISDSLYDGTVTYDAVNSKYTIEYDPRMNFRGNLMEIEITDGADVSPVSIVDKKTLTTPGYQIKGDPSSATYGTSIGTIVFNGAAVTIYNSKVTEFVDATAKPANCYVVKPNQGVTFNAKVKGNSAVAIAPTDVRLVWQTAEGGAVSNGENLTIGYNGNVLYNSATGTATVVANKAGNAVVAAYDGSGNVLWSWHIWVSPVALADMPKSVYNTATFQTANGAGKSILDRNLGAVSATSTDGFAKTGGMLYQWGRKDPFAGMGNTTSTGAVRIYNHLGVQTDYQVVKNSADNTSSLDNLKLYYSITNVGDWTSVKSDNLWTSATATDLVVNNQGVKSLNDPCPAGYRVATGGKDGFGTWGALGVNGSTVTAWSGTGLTAGYSFDNTKLDGTPWYAAAGLRDMYGFSGMGAQGVIWSASVNGASAIGLKFDATKVYPNASIGRATTCAIRCVEE